MTQPSRRRQPRRPGRLTARMEIVQGRSQLVVEELQTRFLDASLAGAQLATGELTMAAFGGLQHRAFSLRLTITRSTDGTSLANLLAEVVWIKKDRGRTTLGIKWAPSVEQEVRQTLLDWVVASA